MSRAAILPFPGDPFLLNYWLTFFENIWSPAVDRLYIYMNASVPLDVVNYCEQRAKHPKIVFIHFPTHVEHGTIIKLVLKEVAEKYVMLVEDDAYIWKVEPVDYAFRMLESGDYDVVGSKRGSCGQQILKVAQEKWGLSYEGYGDQGPNFWPCFFFAPTKLLRRIDNFGARLWKKGELIEPLGVTASMDQAGDTMVEASLQIRKMTPPNRILTIPQYHVHPLDLQHAQNHESIWDGQAGWLHVGSLSSGISGLLRDGVSRPLTELYKPPGPPTDLMPKPTNDFEVQEYERRVQWWSKFYERREIGKITEFADLYGQAIDQLIRQFGLNRKRIARRWQAYNQVYNF